MFGMMIRSGSFPSRASSSAKLKSGTTSRPPDSATGTLRSAAVTTLKAPAVLNATYGASVSATSVTAFPNTTATVGLPGSNALVGKSWLGGGTGLGAWEAASVDRSPMYPTARGRPTKATS
jgi:hypothetical protein